MSSVNETIGAHEGAVTAIVTASLTPIVSFTLLIVILVLRPGRAA